MKSVITFLVATGLTHSGFSEDNDANNISRNTRDHRESEAAISQSHDPSDLKLIAEIRKLVAGDEFVSKMAKNAEIISVGGAVTLRGSVDTHKEKILMDIYAKRAGAKKIANKLEIKKS
jgi:hypothetical protein